MSKQPLYPHIPKKKESQYPHTKVTPEAGELQPGTPVRMKSGTEGWIRGTVVEYFDLIPSIPGMIYVGPGYKVRVLEGKHKGEVIRLPANYVERE